MVQSDNPRISVIVPMYNAATMIERCLTPLVAMRARGEVEEVIVVNDCSTDRSADIVAAMDGVRLLHTPVQGGPGAARNLAAFVAAGSHLWFVDSDVVVTSNAGRIVARALAETGVGAVFGCYDDRPEAPNFLSQYKNLVHRYYHSRGNAEASTFWAGCGAVERELFCALGGFDAARYRYPSIEDIELGYRMVDAGRRIVLQHDLQGKHLKVWRLKNLLHTEIFRRAVPWSTLMLERKHLTDDLNVSSGERMRAALAAASLLALAGWAAGWLGPWPAVAGLAACLAANRSLIAFFVARRGPWFGVRAFLYHQFYYLYSSAAFGYVTLRHVMQAGRPPRPAAETR